MFTICRIWNKEVYYEANDFLFFFQWNKLSNEHNVRNNEHLIQSLILSGIKAEIQQDQQGGKVIQAVKFQDWVSVGLTWRSAKIPQKKPWKDN